MQRLNYLDRKYYYIYLLLITICINFSCENNEKTDNNNDITQICDTISEYIISDFSTNRVSDIQSLKIDIDENYNNDYELYISRNSFYIDDCDPVDEGDCYATRVIFIISCLSDNFYVGIEPDGPFVIGTMEQPKDFGNINWATGIQWISINGTSAEFWRNNNLGFIPIKFINNNCVYIGWIEAEISFDNEEITVSRYAYKSNI